MNKQEFLVELKSALSGLPEDEIEERLSFYGEAIDDRTEEGMTEEEAVKGVGSIDDIVYQTISDVPMSKLVKERIKPNRALRVWEIVLLILGFPLWFPLLVSAAAVIFSLYISVWAIIVSLWAVEISLILVGFAGIISAIAYYILGYGLSGTAMLGAGIFVLGVSVFMFFGCLAATKCILLLTKKAALGVKKLFVRKEN